MYRPTDEQLDVQRVHQEIAEMQEIEAAEFQALTHPADWERVDPDYDYMEMVDGSKYDDWGWSS